MHVAYARQPPQRLHQTSQVLHIFGIDHELDLRVPCVPQMRFHGADVGVLVADDGGYFLQHPSAIVAVDGESHRIRLLRSILVFRSARPFDSDAAVGLVKQVLHVGTAARMDGYALAARDVADDFLAADGIATSRAIDQQLVLAFDDERISAAGGDCTTYRIGARTRRCRCRFGFLRLMDQPGGQTVENLTR